jgi:hypothetical protein
VTTKDPADRRRKRAVIALLGLAAAAVVGFGHSLTSCAPQSQAGEHGQPASGAQLERLASVRVNDLTDGQSAFRATIGTPGTAVHVTGWVDWRRPIVYLTSTGDHPGPADGLVQAVPPLVAVHLGRPVPASDGTGIVDPYPPPPAQPPADGWRVRRMTTSGPDASPFDGLLALLFGLAADKPDDARALAADGPRFLRRAMTGGVAVDVITGPAVLPAGATGPERLPSASPGTSAQVSYWLDDGGRIRRLDALLRKDLPLKVEFSRDDRTRPAAVEALGGAPVTPRAVTAAQAAQLSKMAVRDRTLRGAAATVTLPFAPAGLLHAAGWLDWRNTTAYLVTQDADDASRSTLVWADKTGVITRLTPHAPAAPPNPLPRGGWQLVTWAEHDKQGASDLDVLLGAALSGTGDPATLRSRASWLRTDTVAGVPVTVYELRGGADANATPGQGLLRYWLDNSGALRRIEVRAGDSGYGCLDLSPAVVPVLSRPATT